MEPIGGGFDRFDFTPSYEVEADAEFPADGVWRDRVFRFDPDGRLVVSADPERGAPRVVRVAPSVGDPWVGFFPGGVGGVSGAFAMPAMSEICVAGDGLALIVDVEHPEDGAMVASPQVQQVVAVPDNGLLLLATFTYLRAFNSDGLAWESDDLFVDLLTGFLKA